MDLETTLEQIGVTGRRAKFYLAALELGEAPVHAVARKAGLQRTTAYDVLARLTEEKLVTSVQKRGKVYVAAEDPRRLLRLFDERQQALATILPELQSLYNRSGIKPKIRYYEGREGLATVFADTLECHSKQLSAILSMADLREAPGNEEEYIAERVRRGIQLRVIRSPAKELGDDLWPTSAAELRELRYAPRGTIFSMTTWIYDDKVSMISSSRENFGMIIESAEFSQTMTNLFTVLWTASTPDRGRP
jgi:sugar-specific transcriptional regulator TrmB